MIHMFEIGWRQNLSMASWRLATRFGEAWRGCLASVGTREGLARQDSSKVSVPIAHPKLSALGAPAIPVTL